MTVTAHFASARAELIVVERPAQPMYGSNGRLINTEAGKYHRFHEHRCRIEGQKSIDYVRDRMKAPDSPGLWEIDADDVPDVVSLLSELAVAPTDRVREILQAEEDGPSRDEVVAVAHAILERAGVSPRKPGGQPTVRTRHETVVT
jgi:hypothetical protein